jgi:hypothetical protein
VTAQTSRPDDSAASGRARLRRILLIAIGLLYVLSVPWYRADASDVTTVFGLPDWVAFAIGCYVAVACLNSWAWLLTDVPDSEPSDPASRKPDPSRGESAP